MRTLILVVVGVASFGAFGVFALQSVREAERRAAKVACGVGVLSLLLLGPAPWWPSPIPAIVLGMVLLLALLAVVAFLLPIGRVELGADVPQVRFDERDIMFARARLVPDSPNYQAYYALRPETRAADDRTRSLPGLLSLDAREANPLIFKATEASFNVTEALRDAVDGPVKSDRDSYEAMEMTATIKALARYHGAHSVGIALLQPYHVYSHIGRGSGAYGAPVRLDHRYGIAYTVEMDRAMVGTAPAAPITLESARQYVEAAKIGIQLGNLIRGLGYAARAHIDGNYRVITPLVARDAGLGEIGRMGLLMTPRLGPRVRLGVVTTDMPLAPDQRDGDASMIDFCGICKKCADNCPVQAIPTGDRREIDGALRWRIDSDTCFRYWNVVGTDCGRCIAVCPYSYPDSATHNLVRRTIRRSGAARRAVYWLDGIFYGAKPAPKAAPAWVPPKGGSGDLLR